MVDTTVPEYTGDVVPLPEYKGDVVPLTEYKGDVVPLDEKKPLSTAAYLGKLRSDPEAKRQMAGATGRAVAHFLTTGGGLGEVGVMPFLGEQEYKQYVQPYVGETPKEYQNLQTLLEMTPMAFGVAKATKTAPEFLPPKPQTAEELLTGARSLGEQLTTSARTKAEELGDQAEKERLSREIAIKKEMARPEKVAPEIPQIHEAARSETKFAAPDTDQVRLAGQDLNSSIRSLSDQKLGSAEKLQTEVGGKAFKDYESIARNLQSEKPFGLTQEGQALKNNLDTIIGGGEGSFRKYGQAAINIARDVRNELFGRRAQDISLKEIQEVADRLPKSFSQTARETQARNIIMERGVSERRPVDWKLVDDKLRELRQIEASKTPEAATAIAKERYGSTADLIENALKGWVGEENYPREAYAAASQKLNQFRTDLGRALTEREEIPYTNKEGMREVSGPAKVLFANRDSVNFGKQLLGEKEVSVLAERHAANQLKDKTGAQIKDWLSKNDFVYEVPGLYEKINAFGENVARREGDAKALAALQQQMKDHLKTVGTVADQAQDKIRSVIKTINQSAQKIAKQSPDKIRETWLGVGGAPGLRTSLEETGMFEAADLDRLEGQLLQAGNLAEKEAAAAAARQAIGNFLKYYGKKIGLPLAGVGLTIEAGKSLLGGK
jgi:hypothetical protein